MTTTSSLTFPAALDAVISRRLEMVHTHLPGRVVTVASDGSSVDVEPLIRGRFIDETGAIVTEALPVVPTVPVMHPYGGDFALTFPVAVGDTVLLAFSEASLDRWKSTGNSVDPGDYSRFNLTDAVAILGLSSFAAKLVAPNDRVTLGAQSGMQVHVTSTQVLLGGSLATDFLALKSDLDAVASVISAATTGDGLLAALKTLVSPGGWPLTHTALKGKP